METEKTFETLRKYIIDNNYPNGRHLRSSAHQDFVQSIIKATEFLDEVYKDVPVMTRCFVVLNDIKYIPACLTCGKRVKIGPDREFGGAYHKYGFRAYCSRSCMTKGTENKRRETMKERFGSEHPMYDERIRDKVKQTNQERYGASAYIATEQFQQSYKEKCLREYGVSHHMASENIKNKTRQTNFERYGAANPFVFARDKIESTNVERYGVRIPAQNKEIKNKIDATMFARYGNYLPLQNNSIRKKMNDTRQSHWGGDPSRKHYSEYACEVINDPTKLKRLYNQLGSARALAEELGISSHSAVLKVLHDNGIDINYQRSAGEGEICSFLDSLGIDYKTNIRILPSGKELDIYIPSKNLGIEYNGVFWHSDRFKERLYHQNKALECLENGLGLIHVWEDWWKTERTKSIVQSMIRHRCRLSPRVQARNCYIVREKYGRNFHNKNHIQGKGNGAYHYGLRTAENGMLVAVLSVNMKKGVMEIDRYSSSMGVVGGFGKLLKASIQEQKPNKIRTFSSLDYGTGEMYYKLGFEEKGITPPNYYYFDSDLNRFSRVQFQKHKLPNVLDYFDSSLTEKQNVKNNGYMLVYDSGSIKFEKNLS